MLFPYMVPYLPDDQESLLYSQSENTDIALLQRKTAAAHDDGSNLQKI